MGNVNATFEEHCTEVCFITHKLSEWHENILVKDVWVCLKVILTNELSYVGDCCADHCHRLAIEGRVHNKMLSNSLMWIRHTLMWRKKVRESLCFRSLEAILRLDQINLNGKGHVCLVAKVWTLLCPSNMVWNSVRSQSYSGRHRHRCSLVTWGYHTWGRSPSSYCVSALRPQACAQFFQFNTCSFSLLHLYCLVVHKYLHSQNDP